MSTPLLATEAIALRIAMVRGQRVLLDADLAALYEVETKRFNEAVRRNLSKFPADFMFQLTTEEWGALRSQLATLDAAPGGRGRHRKYLPYAFTEHGAIMAANLLSSPRAIEVSVYVVRAFVHMRELAATHGDLAKRLSELEQKTEALAIGHDTFSRNTRHQLRQVFDALRELVTPPDPPKRPIGFVHSENKNDKAKGTR
ncbi:MAG: ORF6N domain-containing protein [Rubrivivax sp.]